LKTKPRGCVKVVQDGNDESTMRDDVCGGVRDVKNDKSASWDVCAEKRVWE
jgi:hypothetical protein